MTEGIADQWQIDLEIAGTAEMSEAFLQLFQGRKLQVGMYCIVDFIKSPQNFTNPSIPAL